jgi:hypothetical protein
LDINGYSDFAFYATLCFTSSTVDFANSIQNPTLPKAIAAMVGHSRDCD